MPLVNACKAYTLSEGSAGTYVLSGAPTTARSIAAVFVNGQQHAFYITDGTNFELILGQYNTGGSITRITLYHSSNADAPVVWGAGQKLIEAVARVEDFQSQSKEALGLPGTFAGAARKMLRVKTDETGLELYAPLHEIITNKPPGEDIVITSGGQSQSGFSSWYAGALPALQYSPGVFDWNTNGAASPSAYGWQNPHMTDPHISVPVLNDIRVGYHKESRGHFGFRLALLLNQRYGRRVRLINVWRGGTTIDDPDYGWLYKTPRTNAGGVWADTVLAALANLRTIPGNEAIYSPDIAIWAQQSETVVDQHPSNYYGWLLANMVQACEDPLRWGWGDKKKLRWFFLDRPYDQQLTNPGFNGYQVAKHIVGGGRCHIVNTDGLTMVPAGTHGETYSIHWNGESHDLLAERMEAMLVTPAAQDAAPFSGFRYRPNWRLMNGSDPANTLNYAAPAASEPALFNWNTESLGGSNYTLRLSLLASGFFNYSAAGMKEYRAGDTIQLSKVSEPFTVFHRYTLTGPPAITASSISWPATLSASAGSFTVGDPCTVIGSKPIFDGTSTSVYTESDIYSTRLDSQYRRSINIGSTDDALLAVDASNKIFPIAAPVTRFYREGKKNPANPNVSSIAALVFPANSSGAITFNAIGKLISTGAVIHYQFSATWVTGANSVTISDAVITTLKEQAGVSYSPRVAIPSVGASLTTTINLANPTGVDTHWAISGEVIVVPTLP